MENDTPKPDPAANQETEAALDGVSCSLQACPFCASAPKDPAGQYNGPQLRDMGTTYAPHGGERRWHGFVVFCPYCEACGPRMGTAPEAESEWNTRELYAGNAEHIHPESAPHDNE